MIRQPYTSPTDQGLQAIDVALQFPDEYAERDLARLGETTRLVMEFVLANPNRDADGIAKSAVAAMGECAIVSYGRMYNKANQAKILLQDGVLVSDERLIEMTLNNGLTRPAKIKE